MNSRPAFSATSITGVNYARNQGEKGQILNYGHTPQLRAARNDITLNYGKLAVFGYVDYGLGYGVLPDTNQCQLRSVTGAPVTDAHLDYGPHTLYKCVAVIEGLSRRRKGGGELCR